MENRFCFNINFSPYGAVPSPVVYSDAKLDVDRICAAILGDVLRCRTYYDAQVEGRQYTDEHAMSDARMFLQCAFMCVVQEQYGEALNWYNMAHKVFCGDLNPAVVSTMHGAVWMQCDGEDWGVYMNADIVTQFGNTTTHIKIADITPHPTRPGKHTISVLDRMEELRYGQGGWLAHLDKSRAAYKQQQIDAKGLDCTYDDDDVVGETK